MLESLTHLPETMWRGGSSITSSELSWLQSQGASLLCCVAQRRVMLYLFREWEMLMAGDDIQEFTKK